MIVIQAYSEVYISTGRVEELLGMKTRLEADVFLQTKGIYLHYDESNLETTRQSHQQLRQEKNLKTK